MSMEENNNAKPLGEQTTFVAPSSNVRLKTDMAWRYVNELQDEHGRKSYFCTFCQKTFHGGGINRMKQHLAGVKGNVCACPKVRGDVKVLMRGNLEENNIKAKEKRGCSLGIHINLDENEEVQTQTTKMNKRKASSNLQSFFKQGINDLSQPLIKSSIQSKERSHDTNMALALWFYDVCIPMNAVNSPLFPIAMSKIASMGHGYNGPSYHDICVNLLKDAKQSVHLIVESYRKKIVGPKNVVHMVTDNVANYKAAGKLLYEKYPFVCWSLSAAHCINLIMNDIGELSHVDSLITLASRVTIFIYNHKWPLNWLRKRPGWTEIIRPGAAHFGTTFIVLKSLHDHKNDLQAMVTSNDFKKVIKLPKAMEVKIIIIDETFWKNCLILVNVMAPLLRFLLVCDSNEKPSLGYVYEGMLKYDKRSYDLVDYECIDQTEFWVVEEESEGEIDLDELDNMVEEEP
ncbi:uncharacterized protein LOC120181063 [Hibiscus syriacus]|uniref:uncharacterized protein LOC120181063 n=1 Tax=Hibiscus syriacus TaxID=106335 RepID=UPI001922F4BC|nr:uncharacterized protein LOC120181063 [Hibiscus syriacus]